MLVGGKAAGYWAASSKCRKRMQTRQRKNDRRRRRSPGYSCNPSGVNYQRPETNRVHLHHLHPTRWKYGRGWRPLPIRFGRMYLRSIIRERRMPTRTYHLAKEWGARNFCITLGELSRRVRG